MTSSDRGPGVVEQALGAFPRVVLGHWPTPLQPCRRLREEIGGPLVWLKRDDCSGLATGGNKTRKLEFLLGAATAAGASGVVTFGALQSNHARQTAAACAALGLPCHLVLTTEVARDDPHYLRSGNVLLDGILGATVHPVADATAALELAVELGASDPDLFLIEPGGSNAVGTLGYVAAAGELVAQTTAIGIDPARIVVAASTGGTTAGLVVGTALAGVVTPVVAAAVYESAATTRAAIERLVESTVAAVGAGPVSAGSFTVDDRCLGPGYGIPTEASQRAIEVLARTEGVLLDPVYTSKAFALLLDDIERGDLDGDVVFVHTGGQAGLFAYADAFSAVG